MRGTTSPIRPIGTATVGLSRTGAYPGAYPGLYPTGVQTVPLAADGTFSARATTAAGAATYRWTANVRDIDETTATASADVAVAAKQAAC